MLIPHQYSGTVAQHINESKVGCVEYPKCVDASPGDGHSC